MAKTEVVNLRTHKYDVYIGRDENDDPGEYGNPFIIGEHGPRDTVVEMYRIYFIGRMKADPIFRRKVRALKGKKLGCYCKPERCHGDVIAAYLNNLPAEEAS